MQKAVDIIQLVAPRALPNYLRAFASSDDLLAGVGIDTPIRLAHFIAQVVLHETGGGTVLRESMTYTSGARILAVFGVTRPRSCPTSSPAFTGTPQALAERVYGLGNPGAAAASNRTQALSAGLAALCG